MRWLKYLIIASGILLVTQLMMSPHAYAATDYDDVITNATLLKLAYPGYTDMDITTSYMGYILGTRTDGVAYNDCSSACRSVINNSLDSGDYSINQVYSIYPSPNYSVQAYFCDEPMVDAVFQSAYNGQEKSLYGSTAYPANCVNVTVNFQSVTSGGHIFVTSSISSNVTTNAITIADKWTSTSGATTLSMQPFIYTGAFTPPSDYSGEIPQSSYTTTAPTTAYTGTIDCGGVMPIAMSIYQPGNNGVATLVQQSLGIAQWTYNLTSEPYSFTVDCGDGKLAAPFGAVDPTVASNDWTCDISSTEPYHCTAS